MRVAILAVILLFALVWLAYHWLTNASIEDLEFLIDRFMPVFAGCAAVTLVIIGFIVFIF